MEARHGAERDLADATANLHSLLASVDAVNLFVAVVAHMAVGPEGSTGEATHGAVPAKVEMLAYHAYPFFQRPQKGEITPWHVYRCTRTLDKMLALRLMLSGLPAGHEQRDAIDRLLEVVRTRAEIVRGSAYPEQTASEIVSIQGHFKTWFERAAGIGPTRAQHILWSIASAQQNAVDSAAPRIVEQATAARRKWQGTKRESPQGSTAVEATLREVLGDERLGDSFWLAYGLTAVAPEVLPVDLTSLANLEPAPSPQECEALIRLIGMTRETRAAMSEVVDVRRRPLFVLPDNRVMLVDIPNALDSLWESFEHVARKDDRFYSGRYQNERARWLQQKAMACLARIFPSQHIYQNVAYPDPDKREGATAELDIAVYWRPFLILVEAKARQFKLESQLGDAGRLRWDIKANVEDAFEQARRASRHVTESPNPEFVEPSSGRRLKVSRDDIRRIYLVTVSQHLLAGLATRLAVFKDVGLFRSDDYPLSISIADLDTVTELCGGPDVFLHYVEKRLAIQTENVELLADELDLFGAYLKTRLQPARLWDMEGVEPTAVLLHGFSAQFDDWAAYRRGDSATPPTIRLDVPSQITKILQGLRKRDDYASRWIAFALLDLSDAALLDIDSNISQLRKAPLSPGTFRTSTRRHGDTVVSIVGSLDMHPRLLERRTQMRAVAEKYRHKAAKSIALGIMVRDSSVPFHCAAWAEGPWQHDAQMEDLIANEPAVVPAPATRLPGRNAPCPCGSGKKFKKCCLPRIEAGLKLMRNKP